MRFPNRIDGFRNGSRITVWLCGFGAIVHQLFARLSHLVLCVVCVAFAFRFAYCEYGRIRPYSVLGFCFSSIFGWQQLGSRRFAFGAAVPSSLFLCELSWSVCARALFYWLAPKSLLRLAAAPAFVFVWPCSDARRGAAHLWRWLCGWRCSLTIFQAAQIGHDVPVVASTAILTHQQQPNKALHPTAYSPSFRSCLASLRASGGG